MDNNDNNKVQSAVDRPASSSTSSSLDSDVDGDVTITSAWREFLALSPDSDDDDADEVDGGLDVVDGGLEPDRKR